MGGYHWLRISQNNLWWAILLINFFLGTQGHAQADAPNPPPGASRALLSTEISPLEITVKSKPCTIHDEVHATANISSKIFQEVRSQFTVSITKFEVEKGQRVKKGQLLATSDPGYLEVMKSIYADYLQLYQHQLKAAENKFDLSAKRRGRIEALAKQGIISSLEVEEVDKQLLATSNERQRFVRFLEATHSTVRQLDEQIRGGNFFSGIDGVVTELIVDPKSLSGKLTVHSDTLIAKVEQPGRYRAEAYLMDSLVHNLSVGLKAEVVLPDRTVLAGVVSSVATLPKSAHNDSLSSLGRRQTEDHDGSQLTVNASQYKVLIDFEHPGPILPSGLHGSVRIITGKKNVTSCLPWNAIEVADGASHIRSFIDNRWVRKAVTIGKTGRYEVEIQPPLPPHTKVMAKLW